MIKKLIKWIARKTWARKEWEHIARDGQWTPEDLMAIRAMGNRVGGKAFVSMIPKTSGDTEVAMAQLNANKRVEDIAKVGPEVFGEPTTTGVTAMAKWKVEQFNRRMMERAINENRVEMNSPFVEHKCTNPDLEYDQIKGIGFYPTIKHISRS